MASTDEPITGLTEQECRAALLMPAVIGPDGRTRWRGEQCGTRLDAQAWAEKAAEAAP